MRNLKNITFATVCLVVLGGAQPNSGWTDSIGDKFKEYIDVATDALKNGIDKCEDNFHAIQDYLDRYPWKGIIEAEATSGPITLGHLLLNGHRQAVVAAPGQKIEAEVLCTFDPEKSTFFGLYQVVVGLKGVGPQALIGKDIGYDGGTTKEAFTLVAPEKEGIYQIRFRPIKMIFKIIPFNSWEDAEGNEPDASTTIGLIIVK